MVEHIKIPAVEPIVRYRAGGDTVRFVYNFPIFQGTDLEVSIDGAIQVGGYDVLGAGSSDGGEVVFHLPPEAGRIVVLERAIPLERVSDFIQGAGLSSKSLNYELDYMMAGLQQVARRTDSVLRYPDREVPAGLELPDKAARVGRVLGFDAEGGPIAVDVGSGAAGLGDVESDGGGRVFQLSAPGAVVRERDTKLADWVSVKDFGALGDGLADDTLAFEAAFAAGSVVYVPPGAYVLTRTLVVPGGAVLFGVGAASRLVCAGQDFVAVRVSAARCEVRDLAIEGGLVGVLLAGIVEAGQVPVACAYNRVRGLRITGARTGVVFDAADGGCVDNSVVDVSIDEPEVRGVLFTVTGDAGPPQGNQCERVRVVCETSDARLGIDVDHAAFHTVLMGCQVSVRTGAFEACVRLGASSDGTCISDLQCRAVGRVSVVRLELGARETLLMNVLSDTAGVVIEDHTGGAYRAVNVGASEVTRLGRVYGRDVELDLLRYGTRFIDRAGVIDIDLSVSVYLVSGFFGDVTMRLPAPSLDNEGAYVLVKKVDGSDSVVRVTEGGAGGPDGRAVYLGARYAYVAMVSNGAAWHVVAESREFATNRFYDTSGTVELDLAVDVYFASSFSGGLTLELPPANAPEARGRRITIKKTDPSRNPVYIATKAGGGPDHQRQALEWQNQAITVMSNGGFWFILSRL